MKRTTMCLISNAILLTTTIAHADDRSDFGEDVKDATGAYHDQYIVDKLITFKLGPKCWKKMHDTNENGIHSATFFVASVREYAKRVTGDDWSAIETQGNSDREKNKALVEKMVNEFAPRFSFTLINEGDDCDTTTSSLLLRYWTTVGDDFQYLSGKKKVSITLDVTPTIKDIEVKVSGGNITIKGSRDIEPAEWDAKIAKAFRRAKL